MKRIKEPELPEWMKNMTLNEATWSNATPQDFQAYYHHWLKTPRFGNHAPCSCSYCIEKAKTEEK